jgi:MFS family permease
MLIFMAIQVGMAVLAAFAGRAADRMPIRWLVLTGGLFYAAGLALSAYAQALWQIGLIFSVTIVMGLLLAGSITAQTITARWFDRNVGTALGIVSTGSSIGGLLLPMLIVFLQSSVGWREANLWLAGLVIVIIAPACLLLFDKPQTDDSQMATDPAGAATSDVDVDVDVEMPNHPEWTFRSVISSWSFWSMALCFTAISTIFTTIQQNLAPLALDNSIDALAVSTVVAVMAFVMIAAKLLFGFLADRIDIRVLFLAACSALAMVLLLLSLSDITYFVLLIIAALAGVAVASSMPLSAAIIRRDFGPQSFGRVKGLMYTVLASGAIGPWIAGTIYDRTGSYDAAWLVLGLLLIPAAAASSGFSGKATAHASLARQN